MRFFARLIRTCPMLCVVAGLGAGGWARAELEGARLEGSAPLSGGGLQPAKLQPGGLQAGRLQAAAGVVALRRLSAGVVSGGISAAKVKGAASVLPPSQLGELFFGVAGELERLEGGVTHTAVGYYMAALTDPDGRCFGDAQRRLREILLQDGLPPLRAAALYDGGLSVLRSLCEGPLGIAERGVARAWLEVEQLKAAYHGRRVIRLGPPHR